MKPKFQPTPSRVIATAKWPSDNPDRATATLPASSRSPAATTGAAPKRAISAPVKKLGANIATMCHWMAKFEAEIGNPQRRMASGAEVIRKFISR